MAVLMTDMGGVSTGPRTLDLNLLARSLMAKTKGSVWLSGCLCSGTKSVQDA